MVGKEGIEPSSLGVSDPRSDLVSYLPGFFYFFIFSFLLFTMILYKNNTVLYTHGVLNIFKYFFEQF